MPNLILTVSQKEATKPFCFQMTNIQVYSFEEALYHCYYHFKQSAEDLLSDEMIAWVHHALELPFLASKMKECAKIKHFAPRLLSFLTLTDYFSPQQLEALRQELVVWENRFEWEKLKERGDELMHCNEPEKAFLLYNKALLLSEKGELLHNAAVAAMGCGHYQEAVSYFERALGICPTNQAIYFGYIESLLLAKNFEMAQTAIEQAKKLSEHADLWFFMGKLQCCQNHFMVSIPYFQKALEMAYDAQYVFALADVYVQMRQYEKALETLEWIKDKDKIFLIKQAELYVAYNNIPAAIKSIEKALLKNKRSVDLWVRLAMYHRLDYNHEKAYFAINTARNLSSQNPHVLLEWARIEKTRGNIKEYQTILNRILKGFKEEYRENLLFV